MKITSLIVSVALLLISNTTVAQLRADPKPRLYPNKHLSQVGQAKANQDIAECSGLAAADVQNSRQPGEGLKHGARGAVKGAALGTVGGAIAGNTGRGAAAGAVVGVTGSAIKGIQQRGARDPAFQQYANACLEERGYKVLEWK